MALDPAQLQQAAKDHLWMHFTRHGSYKDNDVPVIVRGEGPYIWDANGKKYLDALAGLFVSQLGHGRADLAEAAAKQAEQLAFMPLWSYAHPNAIELAARVADYAPGDLNRVFFTSGGGEAVETAWKLAKNYFKLTGKPMKHKVISRAIAYHGTTQGALSITGLPGAQAAVRAAGALDVPRARTPTSTAPPSTSPTTSRRSAAGPPTRSRSQIENEGPDTVAAVFLEPVQNAGGCFPPPPGYFQRVREICDEYDVLLVSDEVICAFGRLGHMFGCERYGYEPDMITCAKGITSGYAPLGAMIASDRLMEPFQKDGAMFAHGYTFGGHPVSTAVAMANLDAFENENILEGVRSQRGGAPLDPRAAQGPADRRRRPRRRLLLRHRAGQGQGDQGDLHRRGVRAAPLRLRLQAALRRGPLLPRRRPRRPGRPALAAAELHPGALRRDGADPARRPRQGRQPARRPVLPVLSRASQPAPTRPADEAELNERHWSYMDGFADGMTARGPTLGPDRETWTGSVHVVDLPDAGAARAFAPRSPTSGPGCSTSTRSGGSPTCSAARCGSSRALRTSRASWCWRSAASRRADLPPALRDRLIIHGRLGDPDDDRPVGIVLAVGAPDRSGARRNAGGGRPQRPTTSSVHDWEFGGRR